MNGTSWVACSLMLLAAAPPAFAEVDAIEAQVVAASLERPRLEAELAERWAAEAPSGSGRERLARQLRRASDRQIAGAVHAESYADFLKTITGAWSPERLLRGSAGGEEVFGDPNAGLVYTPIAPCRIVDTRQPGSPGEVGILTPGVRRQWDANGTEFYLDQGGDGNCPELAGGGAKAFAVTVTATGYTKSGNVKLYAAGELQPTGATLPFSKGQQKTIANGLIVRACRTCTDQIEAVASGGATHLAIDVLGYFAATDVPDIPNLAFVPDAISGNCATVSIPPAESRYVDSPTCGPGTILVGGQCDADGNVLIFSSTVANTGIGFGASRWRCGGKNVAALPINRPLLACSLCLFVPLTYE